MKLYALFIASMMLLGCSSSYHIKQSTKHRERAISKGATISEIGGDTTVITNEVTKIDTLIERDTVNNTITRTIFKKVHKVDTVFVDRWRLVQGETNSQTRQKERTKRKEAKQETKQVKSNDKKDKAISKDNRKIEQSKNRLWLWVLLSVLFGVFIGWVLNNRFKSGLL